MPRNSYLVVAATLSLLGFSCMSFAQSDPNHPSTPLAAYYAHPVREDEFGVVAPWYEGLNGQLDERARIAVDVYKRYPWVGTDKAVMAAPDFIYNSHWSIQDDGTIVIPPTTDWMCGDLSQRAWSIVKGLTAYYQYSGDPVAFLYIPLMVDYILDYGQTPPSDPWPSFPISTPTKGKAYGKCDPTGRNQLDLCAITGTEVLRAYKLIGEPRYLAAAKHWGDVFAEKCDFETELSPWNRYADPSVVGWSDVLTGSVAIIVDFLDNLIEIGYEGKDRAIVKARDQGRRFLNLKMLPAWLVNDTWGRSYWDWDNPTICGNMFMIADHLMRFPVAYPTWRIDLRNMMGLIINRNGADPASMADTYSGAWAFPESSVCCGTSLSYCQYTAGPTYLRYGALAGDPWAKEIGRRMMLMATYDSLENGVVKDGLLGQAVATGEWSNLAHPWPLCQIMEAIAWAPREFAPNRENHIVRSSSVVRKVEYLPGETNFHTFDAPLHTIDVLRLVGKPSSVRTDLGDLGERRDLEANGFTAEELPNGDWLVSIRHDGAREVRLKHPDVQRWTAPKGARFEFEGTRFAIYGSVGPSLGQAEVILDGERQLTTLDFWNPKTGPSQPVYAKKGLAPGKHTVEVVALGKGNLISKGADVPKLRLLVAAEEGKASFGSGGGPTGAQRMIFGYAGRKDVIDSNGDSWRPATEWIVRQGFGVDTVEKAWWTSRRSMYIGGAKDEELYRYGAHAKEFWANLTVGPGVYDLRLLFADAPLTPWMEREGDWQRVLRSVQVFVNGVEIIPPSSVSEKAGGIFRAWDHTVKGVRPKNGIVRVHVVGPGDREALLQALELTPAQP